MSAVLLVRRYAKALVLIGQERQMLDRFQQDLERLERLFSTEKRLLPLLESPSLAKARKDALLARFEDYLELTPQVRNLVQVLRNKGRFRLVTRIAQAFVEQADAALGIQRVRVDSATPLRTEQRLRLQKLLENREGRTIVMTECCDPALIGGLRITLNSRILDGTVRAQLARMAEIITEGGLSHGD